MDVAISIMGSAVAPSDVRNKASRVAFPLTNCAVTAAAQHIAMRVERDLEPMSVVSITRHYGGIPATLLDWRGGGR